MYAKQHEVYSVPDGGLRGENVDLQRGLTLGLR